MRELIFMALAALSIPLAWRKPVVGLGIYLGINIIRPEMFFWGGDKGSFVFKVIYGLLLVVTVAKGYLSKYPKLSTPVVIYMWWLVAAVFISLLFSSQDITERNYYYANELLKTMGICTLIFLFIENYEEIERLQQTLLWCFGFLGVWGIEQSFRGNERLEGLGGNSWGDSNGVAAIFVLFLPVALAMVLKQVKGKKRLAQIGVLLAMTILIVCTKSRGGFLGLTTCMLAFGFYTRQFKKVILIGLLLLIPILPFASEAYLQRLKTMESSESLDGSAKSRFVLWEAGLMVFADNPVFGTGFLTYPEAKMIYEDRFMGLEDDFRRWVFRTENKKVTHNAYIQVLSDLGLMGGIPYLMLATFGIAKGFRIRKLIKKNNDNSDRYLLLGGICAGLTGFAVCIMTIDAVLSLFMYVQLSFAALIWTEMKKEKLDSSLNPY